MSSPYARPDRPVNRLSRFAYRSRASPDRHPFPGARLPSITRSRWHVPPGTVRPPRQAPIRSLRRQEPGVRRPPLPSTAFLLRVPRPPGACPCLPRLPPASPLQSLPAPPAVPPAGCRFPSTVYPRKRTSRSSGARTPSPSPRAPQPPVLSTTVSPSRIASSRSCVTRIVVLANGAQHPLQLCHSARACPGSVHQWLIEQVDRGRRQSARARFAAAPPPEIRCAFG